MSELMSALAVLGVDRVGFVQKPIPCPGPRDAVVRTTTSSVCTSDVRHVMGGMALPRGRVLGHESVGVVERVGTDVVLFAEGDRVTVSAITPDGRCDDCQRGTSGQCGGTSMGGYQFTSQRDGCLADYFVVSDADFNLVAVPEALSDEQALYTTDMFSTGLAAAQDAAVPPGGTVAVFGLGPVGLCAAAACRLLGAGLVIAVEPRPDRAVYATGFGVDLAVDPTGQDPREFSLYLSGQGVDAAIEASGTAEAFADCIRSTRPGGVIVNVGYHTGDLTIPQDGFGRGMGDKTIRTRLCPGGREWMTRLLRLVENKRVDLTQLTTHRFSFADAEEAFALMATKADGIIKPLITHEKAGGE
ncbi:alcohol dehydrogenase catalytic domain-containing protein [Streptomyces sp. NPDC050658]|uniref:alcohol dehydrogenase catalytic domain-containing protein n=1 Tax=unclassified Streptomyces TaxID=2593676 RepID=UPI0034344242